LTTNCTPRSAKCAFSVQTLWLLENLVCGCQRADSEPRGPRASSVSRPWWR